MTWIKMLTSLRRHPHVVRMSSALKADRLRVVGGLHAVWSVFDEQSPDGILEGYTLSAMDDEVGWRGFSAAMQAVGWLIESESGLEAPDYEEHNGPTAKRRATETRRKSARRADTALTNVRSRRGHQADNTQTNEEWIADEHATQCGQMSAVAADTTQTTSGQMSAAEADTMRARVRVRGREEEDSPPMGPPLVPSPSQPTPSASATEKGKPSVKASKRAPETFTPSPALRAWAVQKTPLVDVDEAIAAMRDHTFATARTDWDATARNWLRRAQGGAEERQQRLRAKPSGGNGAPPEPEWLRAKHEREREFLGPYAAPRAPTTIATTIDMEADDGAPGRLG